MRLRIASPSAGSILIDPGALLGEQGRAERRGEERAELDHGHAVEHGRVTGRSDGAGVGDRRRGERARRAAVSAPSAGGGARVERGPALGARQPGRHRCPVRIGDDAAVGDELRVLERARSGTERVGPHVGFVVEHLEPLVDGRDAHRREEPLPELAPAPPAPPTAARRARLGIVGVESAAAEERLPEAVGRLRELQPLPVGRAPTRSRNTNGVFGTSCSTSNGGADSNACP